MPNDVVLHRPSDETLVVCGVNHEKGQLIACGYPFPSMVRTEDCALMERCYETQPQSLSEIEALRSHGLESYIDVRSALFHGVMGGEPDAD